MRTYLMEQVSVYCYATGSFVSALAKTQTSRVFSFVSSTAILSHVPLMERTRCSLVRRQAGAAEAALTL